VIAGNHRLGAEAEARQEHLHLLGVVFCASSRITTSHSGPHEGNRAISIVPRSMYRPTLSTSSMSYSVTRLQVD
jgi:hypothetical protein